MVDALACKCEGCYKCCPVLPDDVEVFRASGLYVCEICNKPFYGHKTYAYPSGMNHVIRGCDGVFYHL